MTPEDHSMDAVFSAIRTLLIAIGGFLAMHGLTEKSHLYTWIELSASAVTIVGPAAWGVYVAIKRRIDAQHAQTIAVQAGMAAAQNGNKTTDPATVDRAKAKEIIATYTPPKA